MREFKYKARTNEGSIIKGTIEAENEKAAASVLIAKKLFPIEFTDPSAGQFEIPFLDQNKISLKEKTVFIRQLSTMISAGLPLSQSLATLKQQAPSPRIMRLLDQLIRDIEGGTQLSTAFKNYEKSFTQTEISIIEAGEASGKLDEVLKRIATQSEDRYKNIKKIKNAFIYPAFLIVVVVGIVTLMMVYVIPQMESMYASFGDAKLPALTKFLISASNFVSKYFIFIIILIIAIISAFRIYLKTDSGRFLWDTFKLKIPVIGSFLQINYVAIFARTMESLVGAGVPILDALKIVGDSMPNKLFKKKISDAAGKVKAGQPLSEPLRKSDIFPPLVPQMVRVGEQTGELDMMLKNLADYYDEEIENQTKSMQSMIEPVMMVVMGGLVGLIIIGIMMPLYNFGSITQNVM